jgi:hypothetical protein
MLNKMKSLGILLLMFGDIPLLVGIEIASGQDRIFHASPIDQQQDARLDTIESRQTLYEAMTAARLSALEQAAKPIPQVAPVVSPAITAVATPVSIDPLTGVEATKATIVMISTQRCRYCEDWWSKYASELRAKGWDVEKKLGNFDGVNLYPTFRIFANGSWQQHRGFMSMPTLRKIIGSEPVMQEIRSVDIVQSNRYSTAELQGMIASMRPGGWRGPVYADVQPRSQAKQHLTGPEHGFSWDQVNGLSQDEALILHDLAPRHGNKIFPYRSGSAPQRSVVERVAMASGCPNGDCSRSVQRRRSSWFFR